MSGRRRALRLALFLLVIAVVVAPLARLGLERFLLGRINAALLGHVAWRQMHLGLTELRFCDVEVFDDAGARVAVSPDVRIGFRLVDLVSRGAAAAMGEVQVEAPRITVTRRADGVVNLARVYRVRAVAPVPPERLFHGTVRVRGGQASFGDAGTGFEATFRDLEAFVDMTMVDRAGGRFSLAQPGAGGPATVRGRAAWRRGFEDLRLTIEGDALDLPMWTRYALGVTTRAASTPPMALTAGQGRVRLLVSTAGPIARWRDTLHVAGSLWAERLAGHATRVPIAFTDGRLHLTITRDMLAIRRFTARVGTDLVEAAGRIFDRRHPQVDLGLLVRTRSLAETLRRLEVRAPVALDGAARLGAQCTGAFPGLERVDLSFDSPRLRLAGRVLRDVGARLSWGGGAWRVERVSARADDGGTVRLDGWVFGSDARRLMLDVRARDAHLAAWVGTVLGGGARASADVAIVGSRQSPLLIGQARLRDARVEGVSVSRASGRFVLDRRALIFSDVEATTELGGLRAPFGFLGLSGAREVLARVVGYNLSRAVGRGAVSGGSVALVVAGSPRRLYAAGRVQAATVSTSGVTLRDLDGWVGLSPRLLWLSQGSFALGGGRVHTHGAVSFSDRVFELSAWSRGLDLAGVSKALRGPLARVASGHGPAALEAAGSDRDAAFRLGLGGRAPVEVGARWDGATLRGVAFGQSVGAAVLRSLGLARWHPRGALDVMVAFAVRRGGYDLDVAGRSRGFRIAGIPFSRVSFSAGAHGGAMQVREASLSGPAAVVSLDGRIPLRDGTSWRLRWNAVLRDLHRVVGSLEAGASPARLRRALVTMRLGDLTGHAFASGDISGRRRAPRVDGTVLVDRARLHGDPFWLAAAFRADGGVLSLRDARATLAGDPLRVDGTVGLTALPRLDLTVQTPMLGLQRALGFTSYARVDAAGWLDGRVRVTGGVDHPEAAGQLRLRYGRVGGQPIDNAEVVMRAGQGGILIQQLQARLEAGQVTGSGRVSLNGPLALDLSARDFPLREIAALQGSPLRTGRGDVDVRVEGTSARPRVEVSMRLRDLTQDNAIAPVTLSGRLRWSAPRLELEGLSLSPQTGTGALRADGVVDFARRALPARFDDFLAASGTLDLSVRDLPVGSLLAFRPAGSKGASGVVSGTLQVRGPFAQPSLSGTLDATAVTLGGVDVGTVHASGQLDARSGVLEGFELSTQGAGGALRITGEAAAQTCTVSLMARDVDLAAAAPFVPWTFPFAGRLQAAFDARGPLFSPTLSGRFEVVDGRLAAVDFDAFTGSVSGVDGVYRLNDFVLRKGPHRATLGGTLPLRWERGGFVSFAPMDIRAATSEDSLDALTLFVPDIQGTSGRLRANVRAQGQYPDVQWSGELTVRKGQIRHRLLVQPLDAIDATMRLEGQRLEVQTASVTLGGGRLSIAGTADVAGFALNDINVRLSGKGLDVQAPGYLEARLDADLHLTGSTADPYLVGAVTAKSARVTLPLMGLAGGLSGDAAAKGPVSTTERGAPTSTPALAPLSLPPITFSVDVNLGSDAWLRFLGSAVRAEGQVALVGKGRQAVPTGRINLRQGQIQIPFFPVALRLTSGRAYFDPSTGGWTPYLDATASASVGAYEIFVDASGPVTAPEVRLSSNPPLPPAAIRQLMLGGTAAQSNLFGPAGMSQNTTIGLNALIGVAQATLLRPFTTFFGRLLGMSEVTLEMVALGGVQFTVYKSIDPKDRLYLLFSALQGSVPQSLPRQLYGFEYRFSPTHLFRLSTDNLGGYHVFYQARWTF